MDYVLLVLGVVCAVAGGLIMRSKGRRVWVGVVLGLLLSVIGVIITLVLPNRSGGGESTIGDATTMSGHLGATGSLPGGVELHPGESVVAVIYPWWAATISRYIFTLGLWSIWRRRHYLALTSERLIFAKGIVISKASRSVPLSRIQDGTYARSFWSGGIQISSAGGTFGNVRDVIYRPQEAKAFIHAVNDATRNLPSPSAGTGDTPRTSASGSEQADAIRHLSKLRDDGLITDAEYETKRTEILSRM